VSDVGFLTLGLLLGGAVGVWIGLLRGRRAASEETARLAASVSALNATLSEVRGQLARRDAELEAMRQAKEAAERVSTDATARLEAAREHFAEQRKQITEMQEKVRDAFKALSAEALKSNNEQFITLAEARMKPLREQLQRYEDQIRALEEARSKAYGGLTEKLNAVQQGADLLRGETSQLVAALRSSGAKGRWGEVTLQRIVELSGLAEHCDFETQATLEGGGRPDLVVHLPGGRSLAIDSKVNTGAYLDAAAATDEGERKRLLAKYAADVRGTLRGLSAREYWKQFTPAPEFVVMFMPGEAFFSAAITQDPDLLVDGVAAGVLLASPTTLIALLLAVRHGWQQQQVAENAERIAAAGRELYDRLCTFVDHLADIRGGIARAAEAYNRAVGSWAGRTLPAARKLQDLGAAESGKELPELTELEPSMREAPRDLRTANGE